MVLSVSRRMRSAALACAAAATIAAGALFGAPAQAQIDENATALDWYIFVGRNELDNPIVVYFQSEHATPEFTPVGSIAFVLNREYAHSGDFDPTQACIWQSLDNFDPDDARSLRTSIIYGPNSTQEQISYVDLPIFMARRTALALLQEGVLIDERATVPYFNCAGFVWSEMLLQPPEVWQALIDDAMAEQN